MAGMDFRAQLTSAVGNEVCPMSTNATKRIDIFITLDFKTIDSYFNRHDPAPIYKRQLNYKFEEYIMSRVAEYKRHSVIFYRLNCVSDVDRQYAEPLMYAVKRHFQVKKEIRITQFQKFKKRAWMLMIASITIVIISLGVLPFAFHLEGELQRGIENILECFCWVVLWRPINQLLFEWNPHLKEISLYHKLSTAEVIIVSNQQQAADNKLQRNKQQPIKDMNVQNVKPVIL